MDFSAVSETEHQQCPRRRQPTTPRPANPRHPASSSKPVSMAAASSSSVPFYTPIQDQDDRFSKQPVPPPQQQPKKKRNLPGNPNPDAEVIALSPRALQATNRFICEVCGKGFQREQNLQLHRRGHNLPWKLKQKNPKEARRRVYLCPEPSCVHHDPARALGDLTGIKKHYCRKHGEKKWKCDKCSKKYAVQSDWKAHSKTCGTREYRCDCGTLFSRRDSFITHRAFCDALAQESARLPNGGGGISSGGSHLYGSSGISLGLPPVNPPALASLQNQAFSSADILRLGGGAGASAFGHLTASSFNAPQSSAFYLGAGGGGGGGSQEFGGLIQDLQTNANGSSATSAAAAAGNLFNFGFFSDGRGALGSVDNGGAGHLLLPDQLSNANGRNEPTTLFAGNAMSSSMSSLLAAAASSAAANNESPAGPPTQMSATALLQKAAQMGATTSSGGAANHSALLSNFGSAYSSPTGKLPTAFRGDTSRAQAESESHFQTLMNSLANGSAGMFGGGSELLCEMDEAPKLQRTISAAPGASDDRLTRDFLGVGGVVRGVVLGMRTQGGAMGGGGAAAPDHSSEMKGIIMQRQQQ